MRIVSKNIFVSTISLSRKKVVNVLKNTVDSAVTHKIQGMSADYGFSVPWLIERQTKMTKLRIYHKL